MKKGLPSERANTASTRSAAGAAPRMPASCAAVSAWSSRASSRRSDPAAAVQLGQVGPQPLLARLVAAVGDHQQDPLAAEVADQEGQQVAGGLVGPVQVLDHQHQRGLLAEAPEQAEQQLEQPRLGGLAGRAAFRLAQAGQQPGQLAPGRTDQLTDRVNAELVWQGP